jgi:hypothetical protein
MLMRRDQLLLGADQAGMRMQAARGLSARGRVLAASKSQNSGLIWKARKGQVEKAGKGVNRLSGKRPPGGD